MAIKFSQFNLRTDHTSGMYLVGYDGNQNIHITVDNLFNDFINGTENTIAMFGTDGTMLADSILSQDAGATTLTVAGQLNVDAAATFDTSITVTGDSTLNGNITLGDASTDLITQTGTLYLNGPIKDTTNTLGIDEQILVSDAIGELTFRDLDDITIGQAEAVVQRIKCNEALSKGDPVYIVGFQPGQNTNIVAKADASNPAKMPATGVADEDYAAQAFGTMTAFGSFNGDFDTTGGTENWSVGDILYVKPGGGLTNIKPTGANLIQNIAIVSRAQSQTGELEVIALGRTNDIPNLTQGKIWVGSTGNTIESSSITFTEATGAVQLNQYGSGTITGTAARNLSVDSSGNVIETAAVPANIVETITTTDGTYINLTPNSPTDGAVTVTADLSATGTADATKYLRGDNTWSPISGIYDWNISDGTNSETIASGDTVIFSGDTYITTSYAAGTNTLSIDHDATNRTDTTSADTPGYGGTFTVVDSVTTNATGHLEAINVKTVTMPSTDDTNTTYDLSGYGTFNGSAGVQLVGSDATTDQVAITGAGTTTVTHSGNTITVTSNDQYTGTVTGSGTASATGGQIPYWNATTNITGTSELNYSTVAGGSIGVVGIGNNSTAFGNSRLVVGSGSGGSLVTLYGGGSNTNTIAFANGTSGNAQYRGQVRYNLQNDNLEFLTNGETFSRVYVDSAFDLNLVERSLNFRNSWPYAVGAYIDIPSNNQLSIGTNGSEKMRIDSSGNVGIGTTAPSEKLEVVGNAVLDNSNAKLKIKAGATGTVGSIDFTFNTESTQYGLIDLNYDSRASQGFRIKSLYPMTLDAVTAQKFLISGSQKMVIDSGGKVGIGTNNPGGLLHVSSGTSGDAVVIIESDTDNSDENDNPHVELRQDGGGIKAKLGIEGNAGSTYSNSIANATYLGTVFEQPLQFITGNTGGVQTAKMTIEPNSGNVGIGTTDPSRKLVVQDGGSAYLSIASGATSGSHLLMGSSFDDDEAWIMYNNNTNSMNFKVNGLFDVIVLNSDGSIQQGNSSATGQYAAAFGQNNTASALDSLATGETTTASGRQSFSGGFNTTASGDASFAVGGGTTASGENAFAACGTTVASGISSAAFGAFSEATATNAFAINGDTTASGESSFSAGVTTNARGLASIATGLSCGTSVSANGAFAGGTVSNANAQFSIAYGDVANASGRVSQALGYIVNATGQYSLAQGFNNTVNGTASAVFGQQNTSHGTAAWSLSTGFLNQTRDSASLTVGSFNGMTASTVSREQFMLGRYLNVPRDNGGNPSQGCLVVGEHNAYLNRPNVKFAVGTGVGVGAEADSFTVLKDGNVLMEQVVNKNYSSDSAAASGGVPVGGIYHNSGDLKIRLT